MIVLEAIVWIMGIASAAVVVIGGVAALLSVAEKVFALAGIRISWLSGKQ